MSDCPAGQTARVTSNLHSSSSTMAVSRVPSPPLPEVNTPVAENWCYTQVSEAIPSISLFRWPKISYTDLVIVGRASITIPIQMQLFRSSLLRLFLFDGDSVGLEFLRWFSVVFFFAVLTKLNAQLNSIPFCSIQFNSPEVATRNFNFVLVFFYLPSLSLSLSSVFCWYFRRFHTI